MTAEEIRRRILEAVSKNGGHLASSLGAVEIAMALHDVFDAQKDRIVWDVGHQAYAWKILTDRADRFDTLRTMGGISGFPNPAESPCDAAVAGHAGVAISTAVGFAAARDLLRGCAVCGGQVKVEGEGEQWTDSVSEDGEKGEQVVAVVGDGAIANGTSFEALNNCAAATKKVIVVLNDNEMSISRPVGSMARFLGRLITGVRYNRVKKAAEKAGHALKLTFLRGPYHSIESRIKSLFLGNRFFEQFGLRYIGPIDGHDLAALKAAFTVARDEDRSVLVHVVTKKGKGYAPAEKHPTQWHGVGPFSLCENGSSKFKVQSSKSLSWSDTFGNALVERARKDERIVALTAGMTDGTGLADFAREFPKRFFDVGIAEGHMTAFAAGLAAGGMRPVIAVYSTFLQRAIDEVMHDVCLSNLPVVFCVDRAGVVGSDGATHQGVFDIAMLRCLPNLTIAQPKDADDLAALLDEALNRNGPTVIRYPRGKVEGGRWKVEQRTDRNSTVQPPTSNLQPKLAIWATGDWYGKAQAVAGKVGGVAVHARYLKPFDAALLAEQRKQGMKIVSLENGSVAGGFGEAIGSDIKFGWPDEFIPHGSQSQLEKRYGLDVDSIVRRMTNEEL